MIEKMSRREFGKWSAAACGVAATYPHAAAGADASPKQPNVLVIHTDQHRFDCLGATGNPDVRTPHIDRIAGDGTRFDHHFCAYPVCTPSRYSLLSGRYVHEHRGWDNHCTLAPGTPTFATQLREAGYHTKAVGKMHFTPAYLDVGFDEMILSEQDGDGRWDDDYHRHLREHGLVDRNDLEDQRFEYRRNAPPEYREWFGALPSNLPREFHTTQWVGDRAAETLETWEGGGHLLMAAFVKPHHPFDPPADLVDLYDPDKLTLLPGWTPECLPRDLELHKGYFPHEKLNEAALRRVMAYYYATIEHIDEQVGRMLDILARKNLYDDTLIVFTSDHGEYLGFHHLLLKGNHMYDPLMRVPLLVKRPGERGRGAVSDALTSNVDVASAMLDAVGLEAPKGMHARGPGAEGGRDLVFAEGRGGKHVMVRSRAHKLILGEDGEPLLFFDLEQDPFELTDRAGDPDCRDRVAEMRAAAHEWRPLDELPPVHLDERAPIIKQPNARHPDDGHREDMVRYFAERMSAS